MTGMQTVIELRQRGMKPSAVFVDLVDVLSGYDAEEFAYAEYSGIVSVIIPRDERLAEIDFRPLAGLSVFLVGDAEQDRQRALAKLIATVEPSRLVLAEWDGEDLMVHQRTAGDPPTTTSYAA